MKPRNALLLVAGLCMAAAAQAGHGVDYHQQFRSKVIAGHSYYRHPGHYHHHYQHRDHHPRYRDRHHHVHYQQPYYYQRHVHSRYCDHHRPRRFDTGVKIYFGF